MDSNVFSLISTVGMYDFFMLSVWKMIRLNLLKNAWCNQFVPIECIEMNYIAITYGSLNRSWYFMSTFDNSRQINLGECNHRWITAN